MSFKKLFISFSLLSALSISAAVVADESKLIATAGLSQIEGAGGGGIVPWATLSGYDTQDQISVSAALSQVDLADYRLNVQAVSASFYDQIEVSLAHQRLDLKTLGGDIRMNIIGAKYKLYGDAVYSSLPQVSVAIQHKSLEDKAIANALGANDTSGTDFYLAATKVHLGAIAGYNAVWNITARASKANELGLLGFGGQNNDSYELMLEASAGVLFSRHLAVGVEYRQKPNNLGLGEDDWMDFFVTYIPSNSLSLTAAYTKLGTIAGAKDQNGLYISINGHL
ncbi:DUF3034 family protein [Glaciecola sp. MF2-115]|uniref:DUF3034 family protein n=1 Tax=Glaciecola sp. MF2-115 TaxID=3384827 RepID=UPI0039A31447